MDGNGPRSAGHLMRALPSTTSMALPAALASPIPLYWLAACPKDLAERSSRQSPLLDQRVLKENAMLARSFLILLCFVVNVHFILRKTAASD